MAGPVALVGSGEFTPAMEDVDRHLLDGRAPRVAHLATAAAPEGTERLRYWADLAARHYRRLGVEVASLPVVDRSTAGDAALAAQVTDVGLVYLSGGDARFLADSLRDSIVWTAIADAWRGGAALAGCSAGAVALGGIVPDLPGGSGTAPGLAVVPDLAILPHFDRLTASQPGLAERLAGSVDDLVLVGIDEDTALVDTRDGWVVRGRGDAWRVRGDGTRTPFA